LDRLEGLGLLNPLVSNGYQVRILRDLDLSSVHYRDLALSAISGETRNPYRLHLEQYYFSRLMVERLPKLSAGGSDSVLWGHELIQVLDNPHVTDDRPIRIVLNRLDSSNPLVVEAKWLIAADGAKSTARHLLQVPFEGMDISSPVVRMIFQQLPLAVSSLLEGLTYARHPHGNLSALRMQHAWRLILRPKNDEVDDALTGECWARKKLANLFESVQPPEIWDTLSVQMDLYNVAQRFVQKRQHGRCLFIGDAAHVTNTRGGFNMNFGLLEGLELAESIGLSIQNFDPLGLDAVMNWAMRWENLTQSVLIPRTARLLDGSSPFLARNQAMTLEGLREASLLDIG
jgi:2-polyprenyl-6-methoxyphenol hydroxylase-like FAD-dependent oxidoreductase